jgi:type II secretory pathway pseudopilin PulG
MTFGCKFRNYQIPKLRGRSRGYILISLMLFLSLLAIAALAVLPDLAFQVRRDREEELIHRGVAYSRGIKRFYKKFGRYPTRIEELENTNNLRFIRQRYKDPITGGDFKILHMGDVGLTNLPVVAPGAGNPESGTPSSTTSTEAATTPSDTSAATESSTTSSGGFSGPVFGGGPILGVASTSKKEAVREFCNKSHYNEWKFIYDPTTDLGTAPLNSPWCALAASQGVGLSTNLTGAPRQQPNTAPQPTTPSPVQSNPSDQMPPEQ